VVDIFLGDCVGLEQGYDVVLYGHDNWLLGIKNSSATSGLFRSGYLWLMKNSSIFGFLAVFDGVFKIWWLLKRNFRQLALSLSATAVRIADLDRLTARFAKA
jgi:hypothetical protein